MFTFKMNLLMLFTLILSTCYATDKNSYNYVHPMNANALEKVKITSKWPSFNKNSKQVRPYNVEAENNDSYGIFVESTKSSSSTSNRVQLYTAGREPMELFQNQNLTEIEKITFSEKQTGNQLAVSPSFQARIKNYWINLGGQKQQIVRYTCCPCMFIRDLPDFFAFFLWLIFYVCALDGPSVICLGKNPTARDVTGGFVIFFVLIRVLKFCQQKYKIRQRNARDPLPTSNYGFNV
jgi:hypothetical protein